MRYKCPVCFFPDMDSPPSDYMICPCCGTEFGLDDEDVSHAELRMEWAKRNFPWFSTYTARPLGWNPVLQLGISSVSAGASQRGVLVTVRSIVTGETVKVRATAA